MPASSETPSSEAFVSTTSCPGRRATSSSWRSGCVRRSRFAPPVHPSPRRCGAPPSWLPATLDGCGAIWRERWPLRCMPRPPFRSSPVAGRADVAGGRPREQKESEMNLSPIRDNFKKFGIAAGLHDVTKKAVNKVVPVRVLCAMKLTFDRVDPEFLSLPAGYAGAFATPEQLRAWQGDARLDLDDAFLRDAATRGDLCYAITWGSDLVSYGWFSKRPTSIADDLVLHFDEAWVYMFKGLTLPEYRGNRLHAIGM